MAHEVTQVRITNGAFASTLEGEIVLRGTIDNSSLDALRLDNYQRKQLAPNLIAAMMLGMEGTLVNDIVTAQRSGDYKMVAEDKDKETYLLPGPIYIVDGQQRVAAVRGLLAMNKHATIGGTIHFNTTEKWERTKFYHLNRLQHRCSPNVLMRNKSRDYPFLHLLVSLTHNHECPLIDRVCWEQRVEKRDLITGLMFLQSVVTLHAHFGPSRSGKTIVPNESVLVNNLLVLSAKVGQARMRDNINMFYLMIDKLWTLRNLPSTFRATHLKGGFLTTLARVMSDHRNFWDNYKLVIPSDLQKKIGTLPLKDDQFAAMAGSNSRGSRMILYPAILKHLNSGKRINKLVLHGERGSDKYSGGTRSVVV